ncbi:MAG: YihY/virulence factor BrkB family protein [Candidatus Nitrotoga sp.]
MLQGVSAKEFLKELYHETSEDDIFNGAASLGYYLTLAIFPAMITLMAMIPYLPIDHVDQAIMDMLREALPSSTAEMFTGVVQEITSEQRGGLLSFGFIGAIWAMSAGMYAIMQQLNITYDVKEARSFIKARSVAVGLSLMVAVLILGAFSLIVFGGQILEWLGQKYGFSQVLLTFFVIFRLVIILLALLLAFALIYYIAPNVEQSFKFITVGSVVGVILLIAASLGFSFYAQNFGSYDATYGSIGAVIVLMLWLYIVGLTILLGSEINALLEHHSAEGKEKGEHAPGDSERDPATRERVRKVAPEGSVDGARREGREVGLGLTGDAAPPTSKSFLSLLPYVVLVGLIMYRQPRKEVGQS